MGNRIEEKSTGKVPKSDISAENSELQINTVVPVRIRRFLYLGTDSGLYISKVDHPKQFPSVDNLRFNYLRAWSLVLFSDEMAEECLKENKDISASTYSISYDCDFGHPPQGGWPSPTMVHLAKEVITSHKGASHPAALFILAACSRAKGNARPWLFQW